MSGGAAPGACAACAARARLGRRASTTRDGPAPQACTAPYRPADASRSEPIAGGEMGLALRSGAKQGTSRALSTPRPPGCVPGPSRAPALALAAASRIWSGVKACPNPNRGVLTGGTVAARVEAGLGRADSTPTDAEAPLPSLGLGGATTRSVSDHRWPPWPPWPPLGRDSQKNFSWLGGVRGVNQRTLPVIFFTTLLLGVAMVAMVATGQPSSGSSL